MKKIEEIIKKLAIFKELKIQFALKYPELNIYLNQNIHWNFKPIILQEIEEFEEKNNTNLPEELKQLINRVGDSIPIPGKHSNLPNLKNYYDYSYELWDVYIKELDSDIEYHRNKDFNYLPGKNIKIYLKNLREMGIYTDPLICRDQCIKNLRILYKKDQVFNNKEKEEILLHGSLILTGSFNGSIVLVLNGKYKGKIFIYFNNNLYPLYDEITDKQQSFLEWYDDWLMFEIRSYKKRIEIIDEENRIYGDFHNPTQITKKIKNFVEKRKNMNISKSDFDHINYISECENRIGHNLSREIKSLFLYAPDHYTQFIGSWLSWEDDLLIPFKKDYLIELNYRHGRGDRISLFPSYKPDPIVLSNREYMISERFSTWILFWIRISELGYENYSKDIYLGMI